jgi:O-antigen/teichoic acid export membrane protein
MTLPKSLASLVAKLLSNRLVAQSLKINALRAVSLGIGFLGSVWSSRCLGPENLGISGMIIGTITPLVLLINLNQAAHWVRLYRGYKTEAERAELVSIISTYKLAVTFAFILIAIPLLLLGNFPPLWHLGLFAAFPYFFLTANAADWLLQSEEKVPAITQAMTVQAIVSTALYLILFRPGMSAGADLVVQDTGLVLAFILAWSTALNGRKIRLFHWQKLPQIIPMLKEGRWLILIGFAVYIFTTLEVPLIGWLYSLKELGIYRTSIVLVGGVGAFTAYIPMLLYSRMIEWHQQGARYLWQQQKKVLTYLALVSLMLALAAFALAPDIYFHLYGPAFQRGAYPFAILLSAKLMALLSGILSWGMAAQKKDRELFYIMMYVSAFSITSNLIFIPRFGAFGASTVNLLSEVVMLVLIIMATKRSLKNE